MLLRNCVIYFRSKDQMPMLQSKHGIILLASMILSYIANSLHQIMLVQVVSVLQRTLGLFMVHKVMQKIFFNTPYVKETG